MNATPTTLNDVRGRWQRGITRAVLLMGALAGMTLGTVAHAQISFRNASSASVASTPSPQFRAAASAGVPASSTIAFRAAAQAGAGNGVLTLTINKPTGTVQNDVMVASIGVRPNTATVTPPAGWTLVRRINSTAGTSNSLVVYYKVAGASEPANYSWTFSTSTGSTGGILAFSGVDTVSPLNVENGQPTPNGLTHATPSVTTTVANTMLVTSHTYSSPQTWTPPTGMTERVDVQGGGQSTEVNHVLQAAAGATGTKTATASADADGGNAHILALRFGASLTISKPAGTVQDDVMIASIAVRPNTVAITPPAGWTLVRRMDSATSTTNSLAVYRLVAGASEPASYTWTLSAHTGAAGGIQTFSGVDTTTPIDVENGWATAAATTHSTPDVTTTVANTMLVTSHAVANANTWLPPSGMTEAYDIKGGGEAIEGSYVLQAAAGATGQKTATDQGPDGADGGNAHILALRPLGASLTISKPAGTIQNDVMIASIAVRPNTVTITPPAGWTLVRRMDNATGVANSLAVYRKVAGASEPASYDWGITTSTGAAGGIQSFSGVDTTTPIDVENGQNTPSSLSHDTPSVTPTVANTMLVTAHTFASSATWTAPSGMTEAYDQASLAVPNSAGQSIVGSYQPHVFLATGVKTATASGDSDTGNAHILALRPLPAAGVAGGFNAYDTTTAAGATSGFVKTKIAGSTVSVDIAALNWPRTAIETTFTGTVRVEVLDASNNAGAMDVYGCRSSWTVLQTLPDSIFAVGHNGRRTVSFTQANSYQDLRLKISYPTSSPTQIGCSNDNFALRPDTFASFSATDNDWQTAGSARALGNTSAPPGGVIHKAGRPFTVQATAVNGAGPPATTTNYAGTPTTTLTDCGGSSACPATLGTLTLSTNFVAGVMNSNTASYDEVGSFNLELRDTTFANVDAGDGTPADCSASGRYVCSSTIAVGRFVPDNFAVALNTPSFGTACGAFTYVGQKFNYATAPVITLTARNFAGGTTANYAGSLWQITNASLTGKSYAAAPGTGTLDLSGVPGTDPVIFSAGAGTGTLTFSSGTGLSFSRTTTPSAPFDADIGLSINVIDADGVTAASNPVTFGTATPGNGIAFTSGKSLRFGRLTLRNANGSQLLPLSVPVEAQYWSGAPINGFLTNTLDSCTTIASANDAMGNYTGNLSGSPTCETAITSGGTLSAGRGILVLAAPGSGNGGSVDLTVNLGAAASGNTCTTQGGAPGSATTANLPHLQGNWSGGPYDQNPTARATFGISRGSEEVVFTRENF